MESHSGDYHNAFMDMKGSLFVGVGGLLCECVRRVAFYSSLHPTGAKVIKMATDVPVVD